MLRRRLCCLLPILLLGGLLVVQSPMDRRSAPPTLGESASVASTILPRRASTASSQVQAPMVFANGDGTEQTLILRPTATLPESFAIQLGTQRLQDAEICSGWLFEALSTRTSPRPAHLARVGDAYTASWPSHNGGEIMAQWRLGDAKAQCLEWSRPTFTNGDLINGRCELSGAPRALVRTFSLSLTQRTAAQGGLEPATGVASRYTDPVPSTERYALSLRPLHLMLVLDRTTTETNAPEALRLQASQWLASVANVASIYENQLGIQLRLQELILMPDDPAVPRIPSDDVLDNFVDWMALHRPRNTYEWDAAFKVGEGLPASLLGLAYVGALGRSDSAGVIAPHTGWATLAHELGHTLGADHSQGGLMNAQANGGGDRNFFTESHFNRGQTSAREIYDHSASVLEEESVSWRHPEEIPFAKNDFAVIPVGVSTTIDVLANDAHQVRFGQWNAALSIDGVSSVWPPQAARLSHSGTMITITPHTGHSGPLWFSYALRGSVGNGGHGWLHQGSVTVQVGAESPSQALSLAPGETRTLFLPDAAGKLIPPSQADAQFLIDAPDQLLLRARETAEGTDSFRVGTQFFAIQYEQRSLATTPDHYWHHHTLGPLRMWPMTNDIPSSLGGMRGNPTLSIGPEGGALAPFPQAFQLVHAENFSPDKGTMEIIEGPSGPTGEVRFTANATADGQVSLRYTVRDPSGQMETERITIQLAGDSLTLIPTDAVARYFIPRTTVHQDSWMRRSYSDRSWPLGALPIGYEDGRGYESWITTSVGTQMVNASPSLYVRIPFQVDDPNHFSSLLLRMRIDDGFVAYLNGSEVARANVPDPVSWDTPALTGREANLFDLFDLTEAQGVLQAGENLLAIHALNAQIDSSDFLVMPELVGLVMPRLAEIASPSAPSVSIPVGTGLRFQATVHESQTSTPPVTWQWQLTESPLGSQLTQRVTDSGDFDVTFELPGTYQIRLLATDAVGAQTWDSCAVHVGSQEAYDLRGHLLEAGVDQTLSAFETSLRADVEILNPWDSPTASWQQLEGPSAATFDPHDPHTAIQFPQSGRYVMRYLLEGSSLIQHDDVIVDVFPNTRTLIGPESTSRYTLPTPDLYHSSWRLADFQDADWRVGGQGLGYDLSGVFSPHIDTDIQTGFQFAHTSIFARYPFWIEHHRSIHALDLTLLADDGCVVYLNGQEVHRQHAPLYGLGPNSTAVRAVDESTLEAPEPISLQAYRSHLRPGYNILAIHGLNHTVTSSDFLIHPTLVAQMGEPNRLPATLGGQASPLSVVLGNHPTIDVTPNPSSQTVTLAFRTLLDVESVGGRLDIEVSSDLRTWHRWLPETTQREVLPDRTLHHRMIGRHDSEALWVRIRVSF